MRWLNKESALVNNLFFVSLFIILVFLTIYDLIFIIFLIFYILFLIVRIKNKIIIILSIVISAIIISKYFIIRNDVLNKEKDGDNLEVIDIEEDGDYNKVVLKKGRYKYLLNTKDCLNVGDIVNVNKCEIEIKENTIRNGFNYKEYLNNNLILAYYKTENIEIVRNRVSIYKIKHVIKNYINKHFEGDAKAFVYAFIVGDKNDFNDDLKESIRINGITHLFALSGLHISFCVLMIKKIFAFLKLNEKITNISCVFFLSIYIIAASFSASIVRAYMMYVLALFNEKKLDKIFSSLDIVSITFILMLIINPFYAFQLGFILSFLATFIISILSLQIKNKNKYMQILYISIALSVASFPITLNISYEINVLSPVFNIFYISLVSTILLPLTFIALALPYLSFIYEICVKIFMGMLTISEKCAITCKFPYMNSVLIFIYYLIICIYIICMGNNKYFKYKKIIFIIFTIFLLVFSNSAFLYQGVTIDYLHLHNGEASIIRDKDKVIVVDTGDGYQDEVYVFLKSLGIKRIDLVCITHPHSDHYGGFDSIYKNIKVKKVITSIYDNSYYGNYNISYKVKKGDDTRVGDVKMKILNPDVDRFDENDNSIVLYMSFEKYDYHVLFLADISKNVEEELIDDIRYLKIDTIKIAHHGSNTSTSSTFLKEANAKDAIIMTGIKMSDKFPSEETIESIKNNNMICYCSKDLYSINYDVKRKKYDMVKKLKYST